MVAEAVEVAVVEKGEEAVVRGEGEGQEVVVGKGALGEAVARLEEEERFGEGGEGEGEEGGGAKEEEVEAKGEEEEGHDEEQEEGAEEISSRRMVGDHPLRPSRQPFVRKIIEEGSIISQGNTPNRALTAKNNGPCSSPCSSPPPPVPPDKVEEEREEGRERSQEEGERESRADNREIRPLRCSKLRASRDFFALPPSFPSVSVSSSEAGVRMRSMVKLGEGRI